MIKILVITGSRGEYGYIRPLLLHAKSSDSQIKCDVLVTNMHLLEKHGYTLDEFEKDNIPVRYKIENTIDGNTDVGMLKSLFLFGLSLADILKNEKYDIILLAGDRGEQLIGAISGFHMNIPVYHIQAGERSGHVDGMTRHAIARYAHIHLAANEDASNRLKSFGEQEFRINNIGAPQLDELYSLDNIDKKILSDMGIEIEDEYILFVYHPVSEDLVDNQLGCENALKILNELEKNIVIICPNSDSGSSEIFNSIEKYTSSKVKKFRNLERNKYLYLLRNCKFIIGNSSSGIIEAPFFKIPCINIGRRQQGRHRAANVVDTNTDYNNIKKSIEKVMNNEFQKLVMNCESPYGSGDSTERLINILINHKTTQKLLVKDLTC
tara:strand:+ start:71811 stop:72950 length:1140 start_codon:yes stop_codon:yes gene_type:complete